MFHAEMIEEYSEKFNLSKADTVAEILRAYPKLIAYKQKAMEREPFNLKNPSPYAASEID